MLTQQNDPNIFKPKLLVAQISLCRSEFMTEPNLGKFTYKGLKIWSWKLRCQRVLSS